MYLQYFSRQIVDVLKKILVLQGSIFVFFLIKIKLVNGQNNI